MIGIYQSFIEGIARLAGFVKDSGARRKVIEALIEGAVMHELGHSLERYSGMMDMQTLFEDRTVRDYMAEILSISRKAEWDDVTFTHVVAQAVAESVTGGQGNANFVQNKSAYLFYKYLSFTPEAYVDPAGVVNKEKIASKIKAYYEANPHLEKWTGNNVGAMVDKVTDDFTAFFGEGTEWSRNFVANAAGEEESLSDEEKAARAAARNAAEAKRPEIINLLRRSYNRKNTSDERANARRSILSLSNNPLLLSIICEEARKLESTLKKDSLESNMLRDTMKPIYLAESQTKGKGAVSRQGGTGEFQPTEGMSDTVSLSAQGVIVPPQIEMLRDMDNSDIKLAALDWDGTISRIREGWEGIMSPMVAALISGIELTPDEWNGILECVKNNRPVDQKFLSRLSEESMAWALEMINETKGEPTPTQFGRACEEARKRGNGAAFEFDYYRPNLKEGETTDETNLKIFL